MALGPIPFTAIDAWASRYRLTDRDEFARLAALIRAADAAYLANLPKPS